MHFLARDRGTSPTSRAFQLNSLIPKTAAGRAILATTEVNDGANRAAQARGRGVVTVVPVTGNTDRVYPFQVLLPARSCGLSQESKAQAEQIRSVAVERVGRAVGRVPPDVLDALEGAIRLHLGL